MEFGICFNVVDVLRENAEKLDEQLASVAGAGFGYAEITATACADINDNEIEAVKAALLKTGLKAKRACILFPGDMKVVGPDRNEPALREYLEKLFPKLNKLGVEIVVFGSGGARRVPDGFDYDTAFDQFCDTAGLVTDIASGYGIKIALEHLNPKECNLLTTIEETVKAVRKVNKPDCGLLFDFYHVDPETEDINNVVAFKDILLHSHIAVPGSRLYPAPEDKKALEQYFSILKSAEYDGSVSIEATLRDDKTFVENLKIAYDLLTSLHRERYIV